MAVNRRNLHELLTSEKERAELNMIVDLERNDVARICKPGTRRVLQPRTIEAYPTVFHAVAPWWPTAAEIDSATSSRQWLRAEHHGSPQVRAMENIEGIRAHCPGRL